MALLRKADEATASTLPTELVLPHACSKSVILQLILALFNSEVLGKGINQQVAVLRTDGAVALVGGVFVQGRRQSELEPHGSTMAVAGV